ncbi:MAG: hypothetical protein R3B74_11605 [Nitrospirales bacterium]|nr:hypothetical protein [Nitrospirales bacterium]
MRLAKKLHIPVVRNYHDLLKLKDVDLVIDVTGDPEVERVLLQVEAPHLARRRGQCQIHVAVDRSAYTGFSGN